MRVYTNPIFSLTTVVDRWVWSKFLDTYNRTVYCHVSHPEYVIHLSIPFELDILLRRVSSPPQTVESDVLDARLCFCFYIILDKVENSYISVSLLQTSSTCTFPFFLYTFFSPPFFTLFSDGISKLNVYTSCTYKCIEVQSRILI